VPSPSRTKGETATVSTRFVDGCLVVSVTGSMTQRHDIGALAKTLEEAIQQGQEKILLDLEPDRWDSYGFATLDLAIQGLQVHQGKVVCRLGTIPIKDARWITSVFAKADSFDTLDEALVALRKDCLNPLAPRTLCSLPCSNPLAAALGDRWRRGVARLPKTYGAPRWG
jgi:hypothetical protein